MRSQSTVFWQKRISKSATVFLDLIEFKPIFHNFASS